ncbi:membrane or secreted protein [Rubripirellula amarantea]|nr:membrane or secreted protein [Rubripirellula amarantea]
MLLLPADSTLIAQEAPTPNASAEPAEVESSNSGEDATASSTTNAASPADAADNEAPARNYVPAIKLLPNNVAGLIRVPDVPAFCEAFKTTNAGRMLDDPAMQPFIESQRERAKNYLESLDNRIGVRLEDIYAIGSGETVLAWLPFPNDGRRPFALVAIADVRDRKKEAADAYDKIDKDLTAGGWTRNEIQHQGQTVRLYKTKPKPGQLKVEQIAIALSDVRIIASDRDTVVTDLLDAVAGKPKGPSISEYADFRTVLSRSAKEIRGPAKSDGGVIAMEWFAKPFEMGRIVRESLDVDRGNQVDVLKLLEGQGFDAIKAAGGIVVMAGKKYDVLHKGYVLAPPTTQEPSKYEKAARMLQFVNEPLREIPTWVGENIASLNRLNVRIEEAFWASESLINEALNEDMFRDIINGIRDDEDGPQIDIENELLPNLDDRVLLLTDNTTPADITSERMLVAIRVKDGPAIAKIIRRVMEAEPDASRMKGPDGVDIWRVQRGESEDDFGADLFDDFADEEADENNPPPLLDHWAIALVNQGKGSDSAYLIFSSHPELLVETTERIINGTPGGLGSVAEVQQVLAAMKEVGGDEFNYDHVARMKLTLRAKYELLRQNKLKDSDSIIASLTRRLFEDEEGGPPDPLDAKKLPPLSQVEKYFPVGGSSFTTESDGWSMTAFFLK